MPARFVLTRSGNNYTLLFTMISVAYIAALVWIWLVCPRTALSGS